MRLHDLRKRDATDVIAEHIAKRLLEAGVDIRYYRAYSTDSRYMKLDDGVLNTVRISNHPGKQRLCYRYEIGPHIKKRKTVMKNGYPSHLYPEADIDILIGNILAERMRRINVWGESRYASFREKNVRDNANAKGFWAKAVPLKL